MKHLVRNVREIGLSDRLTLEGMIGEPLLENQQIVIAVVDSVSATSEPTRQTPPIAGSEIPDWWQIYEGLDDDQIARLDGAIRQRANLTRAGLEGSDDAPTVE